MVPKVTTSESSRACFEYDLRKKHANDQPGLWVAGTVFGTAREMAKQMAFFRKLRPDCKRPIISFSLSLPPNDGRPRPEKWERMVERFLEKMGVDTKTHGWAAHEHIHENPHVHIRLCRVGGDGMLWNQEHSAKRAIKVCAELEEEFNLEKHDRAPSTKKRPTMAEIQMSKHKGKQMPSRQFMQTKIDIAIKNHPNGLDFKDFKRLLAVDQIDVQAYAPGGVLKGVSYLYDGLKWPGSKLGSAYSAGLPERGVAYATETSVEPKDQPEVLKTVSKMPAMLKPLILPAQYAAKEIKPHASHQTEVMVDTTRFNSQVVSLNIGLASTAMLLIAGALVSVSLNLVNMVLALIKRLMAFFGFGMKASPLQQCEHPDPKAPALCYEPTQLALPGPKSAQTELAQKLYEVSEALEANDPNLLPVIDDPEAAKARADVVAAMEEPGGKGGGATTAETENFGFTDEDFVSTNAVAANDPMDDLKTALAAHAIAAKALERAQIKDGPIHFSTVDQRVAELKIVREDLQAARAKWDEFCTEHPFKSSLPGSAVRKRCLERVEANVEAEKSASKAVAAAEAEDARIDKIYAGLPAAVVPAAIIQAEAEARLDVKTAREAIQAEATSSIKAIRSDVTMLPKMAEFELQLCSSLKNFQATGQITATGISILESQMRELRRLKNAQEASRRAAVAEFDGEADKPIIDAQIVK
jgi:hypothetical protein